MRVKSVHARNFRTLVEFDHTFSGGYQTISGQNNAGKSNIILILRHFLEDQEQYIFSNGGSISFSDKSQWTEVESFEVGLTIEIDREADSETYFFLDKFSPESLSSNPAILEINQEYRRDGESVLKCKIDGVDVDRRTSEAIAKHTKNTANFILHNSANKEFRGPILREGFVLLAEGQMSESEKKSLKEAERQLTKRVSAVAKKQTELISEVLQRLRDSFEINIAAPDGVQISRIPLSITLSDKLVNIPLSEWGSGTKNRTQIFMSLMEAARIKAAAPEANKTTPIVVIEEPESFLHPAAQAEFGKILTLVSQEIGIQVISTTHSPYLLNQADAAANTLLSRRVMRGKSYETSVVDTSGSGWMQPFSEILGIVPPEFEAWRGVMGLHSDTVLLVEGELDKSYLSHMSSTYAAECGLPENVMIEAYGGVGSLKNSALLRFVKQKFRKIIVTCDLDAEAQVLDTLQSVGFIKNVDFFCIGVNRAGAKCIEGLLPSRVHTKIYADNPELVQAAHSGSRDEAKSAKASLKKKLLEAAKNEQFDKSELKEFSALSRRLCAAFNRTS